MCASSTMHFIITSLACLTLASHAQKMQSRFVDEIPGRSQPKSSEALSSLLLANTLRVPSSHHISSNSQPASLDKSQSRRTSPEMVGVVGQVLALPALYSLMSFNEYATHRWYQHEEFNRDHAFQRFCQQIANKVTGRPIYKEDGRRNMLKLDGDGHVEHHAETYDDMSLKKDPKWRATKTALALDHDEFRGTAFSWAATRLMTLQMLPSTLPVFALLGFSLLQTFAILLPGMLVHALVWNMLHPPMHGLPSVYPKFGAPSFVLESLRDSAYFKWIYENHQGHHVLGGQKNYNVCCPLADHVLGTYVPTEVWTKKMRAVPARDAVERWGFPVEPKGVPQAPVIAKGAETASDVIPTALKRSPEPVVMQARQDDALPKA